MSLFFGEEILLLMLTVQLKAGTIGFSTLRLKPLEFHPPVTTAGPLSRRGFPGRPGKSSVQFDSNIPISTEHFLYQVRGNVALWAAKRDLALRPATLGTHFTVSVTELT